MAECLIPPGATSLSKDSVMRWYLYLLVLLAVVVTLLYVLGFSSLVSARICSANGCASMGYVPVLYQHDTSAAKRYIKPVVIVPRLVPTPMPPIQPTQRPLPPTPIPPSGSVVATIEQVFGSYSQGALAIAKCESGYNPSAYNPSPVGNSHAEGVFQILYPSTWDSTAYASSSPYNAQLNILAAHQIFVRDGYSWREWQCQP